MTRRGCTCVMWTVEGSGEPLSGVVLLFLGWVSQTVVSHVSWALMGQLCVCRGPLLEGFS